jgi:hypothetical protein
MKRTVRLSQPMALRLAVGALLLATTLAVAAYALSHDAREAMGGGAAAPATHAAPEGTPPEIQDRLGAGYNLRFGSHDLALP